MDPKITLFVLICTAFTVFQAPAAQFGSGDVTFTPRFDSTDWNRSSGECKIRVRIDDEAEVIVYGNQVSIRTLRGRAGTDAGSECTSPLPVGGVQDFNFRKTDGRGRVDLTARPDNRSGRAVFRVRDSEGGDDKYTIEFRWSGASGLGGAYDSGGGFVRPGSRPGSSFSNNDTLRVCMDAVTTRIQASYQGGDVDFASPAVDQRDVIQGEAIAWRGRDRQWFRYTCRIDFHSHRVRDVKVTRR
ncbi:MAG: hypothetical protein HUU41_01495 [Bryobacteraceae bacterium]|nr:hypothetical protein [Bryobacterales bacterium]MEB2359777.1 hypothetical protein [Bryobacterales bacterium]NUM99764.1 hypothetical protein [Bryobacteraceae bacterium]